jgi:hypothetical protein
MMRATFPNAAKGRHELRSTTDSPTGAHPRRGTASFVGAYGGVDGRSYAATETVVSVIRELDR